MSYETPPVSIELLTEVKKNKMHLTMAGKFVQIGSDACIDDLKNRIDDTVYFRDLCCTRSDERTYYNGVLKVLRRKLREAECKPISEIYRRRNTGTADAPRMLKLAGIA